MLPEEAQAELNAENDRATAAFVRFIQRWPNYRQAAAIAQLGVAVALVDMMGEDAEGFIQELRRRRPKATPIRPPPGS